MNTPIEKHTFSVRVFLTVVLLAASFTSHAVTIKKSSSGICHAPDSPYYDKTSNFTPFNSLKECLKSEGARLPRGYTNTGNHQRVTPPVDPKPPQHANSTPYNFNFPKNATKDDEFLRLKYSGFDIFLNCDKRGPEHFYYAMTKDTANYPRRDDFERDNEVPSRCQQKNGNTYRKYGEMWHRGHQVPANHLDNDRRGIYESNYMTNILPQTGTMNTGAWYQTEYIAECYRDITDIMVYGGAIWGNDTSNDHFVKSHGVITPDAFYKVIVRQDNGDAIAWIVPNNFEAKKSQLDNYLTSIDNIRQLTNFHFDASDEVKSRTLKKSWVIPKGCNKG
jgi:endonuclease G